MWTGVPRHQAVALQPVNQAGEPAAGQQDPHGQVVHPQPVLRCLAKLLQHIERSQREIVGGEQSVLQPPHEHHLHPLQAPPYREIFRRNRICDHAHTAIVKRGRLDQLITERFRVITV